MSRKRWSPCVDRLLRNCKIRLLCAVLAASAIGCYSYAPVRLARQFDISCYHEKMNGGDPEKQTDARVFSGSNVEKSKKNEHVVYHKRYFVLSSSHTSAAVINNRGVEHGLRGELEEAKILFLDAVKKDANFGAVYNNLGIVYEIFGDTEKAFEMYSKSCLLEPDNDYVRRNFLYSNDGAHE